MKRLKRLLAVCQIAALCLCLSGCWDMVEINDRLCIRGVGIDVGEQEGMISVTFQMLLPYETSDIQGTPMYQNLTIEAATVSEAVDLLATDVEQKPHFEHLSAIVLGEETAKRAAVHVLDYFYRVPQVRRNCEIVAVNGLAQDLIASSVMDGGVGEYIENMIKTHDNRGHFSEQPSTMSRIFVKDANDEAFYLPMLDYQNLENTQQDCQESQPAQQGSDGAASSGGESQGEGKSADAESLKMAGALLFDERRFVGTLNTAQLDLLHLLQDQQKGMVLTLSEAAGIHARFSFRVDESEVAIQCQVEEDHFVFPIQVQVQCLLIEAWDGTGRELSTEEFYTGAEQSLEVYLTGQLQALIQQTQRLGADVIGFSRLARQTHYQWYQNQGRPWRTAFRAAEFPLTVDVTLKRGGHVQ